MSGLERGVATIIAIKGDVHMMHLKLKEEQNEEGFTLIELLVVVIIIGILAAIAIPVFLNQRERAWDSDAQSVLRNAAVSQESIFTENDSYTTDPEALADEGLNVSGNVDFDIVTGDASGYCMEASHTSSDNDFFMSSTSGAPAEGTCGGGAAE